MKLLNDLALKASLSVGAMTTFALFIGYLAKAVNLFHVYLPMVVFLVSVGTYIAFRYLFLSRISKANDALRQFRKKNFEPLRNLSIEKGDELDQLFFQVYKNGMMSQDQIVKMKQMEGYRQDFLSNVSHELRTPAFAIQLAAEALTDGAITHPEFSQDFLQKIVKNTERLQNLVNDLNAIAQIESGALKMTFQPFHLEHWIKETVENIENIAQQKNIEIRYKIPKNLSAVQGDPVRLRQVLINLVHNAIKYNEEGGWVEVGVLNKDQKNIIFVKDNGIGIPQNEISRLTERFYRVDKSRSRSSGGTGLGLAIVKHILEAHHSQLMVKSLLGRGSTFSFELKKS